MKVIDLILTLVECDPEARVVAEGCDCLGFVEGVEATFSGEVVLLREQYDVPAFAITPEADARRERFQRLLDEYGADDVGKA